MKRQAVQLSLGAVISAALLVGLARIVDFDSVAQIVGNVDMRLVGAAAAIHLLAMLVRCILWQRLLARPAPMATLFRVSIVGFAVSYILPLRIGEVARAYLLARWRGIAYGTSLASLIAERILDGLAVAAILLVALLFVPAPAYLLAFGLVIGGVFAALALMLAMVTWRANAFINLTAAAARYLPHRMRGRVSGLAHNFASGLEPLRRWRSLPSFVSLAVAGWLCQFAVFYLVMLAFPAPASFPLALVGGGVANFATLLPSAPGSVGTFDAALIKLMMDVQGATLEGAAAYALVVHSVVVIPVVVLGGAIVWQSDVTLHHLLGRSLRWRRQSPAPVPAMATIETSVLSVNRRNG